MFLLLTTITLTRTNSDDWTAVQREVYVPLDLENTPLEIKTDSTLGSKDRVWLWFCTTQREDVGGVEIYFYSTPQYKLYYCTYRNNFPSNLPSEVDKIWRITFDKTAGIRFKIHCNGVEVVNFLLPDNTCGDSYRRRDLKNIWAIPCNVIHSFHSNFTQKPSLQANYGLKIDVIMARKLLQTFS